MTRGERGPQGDHGQDGDKGERGPAGAPGADSPELRLTEVLGEVAHSIDRLNLRTTLSVIGNMVSIAAVIVLLFVAFQLKDVAEMYRTNGEITAANSATLASQQADTNRILSAVESVTSAEARATSASNLTRLVSTLLGEIVCEGRRQQARLPALEPGTCRANTPPEVYPGIVGEPLRPLGG